MTRTRTVSSMLAALAALVLLGSPAGASAAGDANQASCPNEAMSGFSASLPDCRAYEMVTPPYKQGYPVVPRATAADGARMIGQSWGVFAGARNPPHARDDSQTEYELARGLGGWSATALAPRNPQFDEAVTFLGASTDLTRTLWQMPTAPVGEDDYYVRLPGGVFEHVGPATPPAAGATQIPAPEGAGPALFQFPFAGASADLSHIVYNIEKRGARPATWPGDETGEQTKDLYEYSGFGQLEPRLVGVSGGTGSTALVGQCNTFIGGQGNRFNAISSSGQTVFFTPYGEDRLLCGRPQPRVQTVYARVNQAALYALSVPSPSRCTTLACTGAPLSDALFQGASSDGTRAFFLSTQQLTDTASEDSNPEDSADPVVGSGCANAQTSGCNLYVYDFTRAIGDRLLTVSEGSASPHVQGVARISQDGSHVYFVAQGALATQPNSAGELPQAGADNLYDYENDAQFPNGRLRYIATVSPEDGALWGGREAQDSGRPAQTTPDGRFFVFQSHADLTPDATSTGVWQVYEYDSTSGALTRVSIGQHGFNSNGNAGGDAVIVVPEGVGQEPRALTMSNDGSLVFFQSSTALTPHALNGVAIDGAGSLANNIYEYRDGEVFLISDGRDATVSGNKRSNVELIGTSETGRDVFFTSGDSLVPGDIDTQRDVYDARSYGGFPSQPGVERCAGSECLGALGAAPALPGAQSALQAAGENVVPASGVKARPRSANRLARALKACRVKRGRRARARCERRARALYRADFHARPEAGPTKGGRR